jgi:hypothetical protein
MPEQRLHTHRKAPLDANHAVADTDDAPPSWVAAPKVDAAPPSSVVISGARRGLVRRADILRSTNRVGLSFALSVPSAVQAYYVCWSNMFKGDVSLRGAARAESEGSIRHQRVKLVIAGAIASACPSNFCQEVSDKQ